MMIRRNALSWTLVTLCLSLVLASGCSRPMAPSTPEAADAREAASASLAIGTQAATSYNYAKDIAPIMSKYCTGCHNTGFKSGGYDFSVYDQGTNPAGTNLQRWTNALNSMYAPPKNGIKQMPYGCAPGVNCALASDVAIMQSWVDGGIPQNAVVATPVASPLSVAVTEGGSVAIVLSAKEDNYTGAFSFTVKTNPSRGTLSGTAPNLSYKANANSAGSDSFTYTAKDAAGTESVAATVAITINAATAPVAEAISLNAIQNVATNVVLKATGPNPSALVYSIVKSPTNGALSGTAPNLSYKSNASYVGNDSFTYVAADTITGKSSNVATVSINVSSSAQVVAQNISVTTDQGKAVAVTLSATKSGYSGPFTYAIGTAPLNGTLSGTAPNLSYMPKAGFSGSDSFTYKATDNTGLSSALATVSVKVNAVYSPVAANLNLDVNQNGSVAVMLSATEQNYTGGFTYTIATSPKNGVLSGTAPALTYKPNSNYVGADSFTYTAKDSAGRVSPAATVNLTVKALASPVAQNVSATVTSGKTVPITLAASNPNGGGVSYSVLTSPAKGTLSGTAPNLVYAPMAGYVGSDTFTYQAKENTTMLLSNTATVSIKVEAAVNQPPIAGKMNVFASRNTAVNFALKGTDPEGGMLTFRITSYPTKGRLTGVAPNLLYSPRMLSVGTDSFTYEVKDAAGAVAQGAVCIEIGINEAPEAPDQQFNFMANRDHSLMLLALDPNGQKLNYSMRTLPKYGTLIGTAPTFIYRPKTDYVGPDSITYLVTDPNGTMSRLATVTINVTPGPSSNYAPMVELRQFYTNKNRPVAVTLEAVDPEVGQIAYAVTMNPKYGSITGTAPYLTYTPSANWAGMDSIQFSATDPGGKVTQGSVNILVNTSDQVPTYYPTVKTIVDAKCARCHQAGGVEFLQLTTYQVVGGAAQLMANAIATGHMPPGQPTIDNSPLADSSKFLTASERELIMLWANGGAPEGNSADNLSKAPPLVALPRVDVEYQIPPHTPAAGDEYIWFEFDWPITSDSYITGYDVEPGPDVHHILVFAAPPSTTPPPSSGPSCDRQPGGGLSGASDLVAKMFSFTSFLPYLPTMMKQLQVATNQGLKPPASTEDVEVSQSLNDALIGGYVPGAGASTNTSADGRTAGIFVPKGSKIKVQFHYNTTKNANGQASGPDKTRFKFMIDTKVDTSLYASLLLNPQWLIDKDSMLIPKNAPATTVKAVTDPFLFYPELKDAEQLEVWGGLFHMHYRGKIGELYAVDSKGKRTLLLKNPKYDYNFQSFYSLKEPLVIPKGTKIESVCTWDNSEAYAPIVAGKKLAPTDYYWGEKTTEEMCLPLLMVAPKK